MLKRVREQGENNRLRKMLHRKKEEYGKKLSRSCEKTDSEAWLLGDPHEVVTSWEEEATFGHRDLTDVLGKAEARS
jgi:hypothetical protein